MAGSSAFYGRFEKQGKVVLKVVNPTNRWNATVGATAKQLADEVVWACELLRHDATILRWFGPGIVPRTWTPRAGVIAQEAADGIPYASLSAVGQRSADLNARLFGEAAQLILGRWGKPDAYVGNFLFRADGKISTAPDPISPCSAIAYVAAYRAPSNRPT